MGHNITVRQLMDRVVRTWDTTSQYNNCWTEDTDMGHNITVRQLMDRVVQTWDTTSQ